MAEEALKARKKRQQGEKRKAGRRRKKGRISI